MRNFMMDDTFQQALSFMVAQTSYIEPQVVRLKYPELNYAQFVPIDTAANEWAKSITFFSVDMVGQADWFNHLARDIPIADIQRQKHEQGIEMAAIGYRYTLEELGQAMMLPNTNLTIERASAARRAYEEMVHSIAMYGDTRKNWLGLTNHSLPAIVDLGTSFAGSVALGTPAGISAVLQAVNGILTNIWQSSLTVEMADTLLLPLSVTTLLSMTQLPNTTMNLMEWILKNNLYTQEVGAPLLMRGVRGLDTASAAGNGRAIAYRKDPEVLKLHQPMTHRFLPVWQTGPIVFDVPGIFRIAGLEIRRPGAFRYLDGC
jgi:hypothetical protein